MSFHFTNWGGVNVKLYLVYRDSDYKNFVAIFKTATEAMTYAQAQGFTCDTVEITIPYALVTTYTTVTFQ